MTKVDIAHEWTDSEIKRLAERLRYHYRKSARELSRKAEKHLKSYERNLEKTAAMFAAGEIDASDFKRWREKWAVIMARDSKMIADYTATAQRATAEARAIIGGAVPEVFAECANMSFFTIDRAIGRNVAFDIMNKDAVLFMMQRNPRLLPVAEESLLKGATARWHSQKFTSAITQGILQGEPVPDVAQRLVNVSAMDFSAAERAARTALTCAENKGRQYSYEQAKAKGIRGQKEWQATLDGRTRDTHRELDGVRVDITDKFPNGLEEPGDPAGDPEEVWNCRCTMDLVIDEMADAELERWSRLPEDVTYEQWKSGVYRTDRGNRETKASRNARTA